MKTSLVIASIGRARILGETLSRLKNQTVAPIQIITVVHEPSDFPKGVEHDVTLVYSEKGLTKQRNKGIDHCSADADYVLFIDDDTFLHPRYIEEMEAIFNNDDNVVGATGVLIKNGDVEISEADQLLHTFPNRDLEDGCFEIRGLYGCNFGVRRSALDRIRFDERLVLYGWLEDADFSWRLKSAGSLVKAPAMRCVHLMYPSGGRANHMRFGFSQVMNPYYLCRKNKRSLWSMMRAHWLKGVPANVFGMIFGPNRGDRLGRLRGNFIAFRKIFVGNVCPEYAEKL